MDSEKNYMVMAMPSNNSSIPLLTATPRFVNSRNGIIGAAANLYRANICRVACDLGVRRSGLVRLLVGIG